MKQANGKAARIPDRKEPETIDGATGKPEPPRINFGTHGGDGRRIDLANLRDVRLELSHLYRRIDAGLVDSREGSRRAYVLRQVGDILAVAELENRLRELEQQYEQRNRAEQQQRLGHRPVMDGEVQRVQ